MSDADGLRLNGYLTLRRVFNAAEIEFMRNVVLSNLHRMAATRKLQSSRHLAGFHRYPEFSQLHSSIAANHIINTELQKVFGTSNFYTIGLSDITVNRSQHWHTDLLRGAYSSFLRDIDPWDVNMDPCIKVLVYLQPGRSLRIVPGSHRQLTPLSDEDISGLSELQNSIKLEIESGDVVFMDIRSVHRGSTDEEMNSTAVIDVPKILVSTVFGRVNGALAIAMQCGNLERNTDWDKLWLA